MSLVNHQAIAITCNMSLKLLRLSPCPHSACKSSQSGKPKKSIHSDFFNISAKKKSTSTKNKLPDPISNTSKISTIKSDQPHQAACWCSSSPQPRPRPHWRGFLRFTKPHVWADVQCSVQFETRSSKV